MPLCELYASVLATKKIFVLFYILQPNKNIYMISILARVKPLLSSDDESSLLQSFGCRYCALKLDNDWSWVWVCKMVVTDNLFFKCQISVLSTNIQCFVSFILELVDHLNYLWSKVYFAMCILFSDSCFGLNISFEAE